VAHPWRARTNLGAAPLRFSTVRVLTFLFHHLGTGETDGPFSDIATGVPDLPRWLESIRTTPSFEQSTNQLYLHSIYFMICSCVRFRYRSVQIAASPAEVLSNSVRYLVRFFSSIASSPSASGLSAVGCSLSTFARKLLISNFFPHSPLNPFFSTLARPLLSPFPASLTRI